MALFGRGRNGDGYPDVIVGSDKHNADRGKVSVYLGGGSGYAGTPAWSGTGENAGDLFGRSVADAGDVNGDGYGDILIGATAYGSTTGKVYCYYGSDAGLGANPGWSVTGETANLYLGRSVAGAGDVNGDGYSDVIVGASGYNGDAGRAYVYLGSSSGLLSTPQWTGTGGSAEENFGRAVSGAGDLNGDGYADVIVGAGFYGGYASATGKVYMFHGSATGVVSAAAWTSVGSGTEKYGIAVNGEGDVDGDGFGDAVIGSWAYDSDRGRISLFHGNGYDSRLVRLRQFKSAGKELHPWGLAPANDRSVQIVMNATYPLGRARAKLEVQAVPAGKAFGAAGTVTNISDTWYDTTTATNGVVITNLVNWLDKDTLYHWRARALWAPYACTNTGITTAPFPPHSPWRSFEGRVDNSDFRMGFGSTGTMFMVK